MLFSRTPPHPVSSGAVANYFNPALTSPSPELRGRGGGRNCKLQNESFSFSPPPLKTVKFGDMEQEQSKLRNVSNIKRKELPQVKHQKAAFSNIS